ncbi:PH domain-containing protein [Agromyces archimandritae]|uniref:PH domain-containing protein n=1 Tax=Agromyces archimandritae TaxID=2781962 RepID=A0A975FNA7_9MICO|nr:PH domain-containing protein [Agromyces archimandritae]QTX05565.1 PH domain-containing protein [Agromyces archimandritae]
MTAPEPGAPGAPGASAGLADGEWHRLHPASPFLRGGLVFLAIAGFVIANLRERLVEFFFGVFGAPSPWGDEVSEWEEEQWAEDPVGAVVSQGFVGWALLAVLVVVIAVIAGYALAWRMHSFRITGDAVEVRSGIVFRSHRSARLDRVQGVNVTRPLFARLFGAAKLEVAVAGESANVTLAYLGSASADGLRRDILRLASGARAARGGARGRPDAAVDAASPMDAASAPLAGAPAAPLAPGGGGEPGHPLGGTPETAEERRRLDAARGFVNARVDDFLAPELDPDLAPPESVVHLPLGRVFASTALGGAFIWLLVIIGVIVWGIVAGTPWVLFSFVPAAIGVVSYAWSRITRSLRYTIAGTPDGVRIGHGLLSTGNQTIPPGRVHAVRVSQWLLWRPFGWWMIQVNLAGMTATNNDQGSRWTVLPVGTAEDVRRVLELLLPGQELDGLVDAGLTGRGSGDGYTGVPKRARWLRPFSRRRIAWALAEGTVLFRTGALVRALVLVPLARMQSVAVARGPLQRALRLAGVRVHTVAGPVTPELPAADELEAAALFERLAVDAVVSAEMEDARAAGPELPVGRTGEGAARDAGI